MKVQIYTLSEITETLRHLSKSEDSITELLKAGDFRWKFEAFVIESRAKRDEGNLVTLPHRLVPITQDGQDVFLLDDIQGGVSKKQFARFLKFIKAHDVEINVTEAVYIPTHLVDAFVQEEQDLISLVDDNPRDIDEGIDVDRLKFA